MAEINIQRKERSVWPWVLAGILLLGLLWFLFARNTSDTAVAGRTDSTAIRDSAAAAGTLAPADTGTVRRDTLTPPPR
jgi:hypothetical protein